jgi:hypothetical protein
MRDTNSRNNEAVDLGRKEVFITINGRDSGSKGLSIVF